MSHKIRLELILIPLLVIAFLHYAAAEVPCSPSDLKCFKTGECIQRSQFCDNTSDCEDRSDEYFCGRRAWGDIKTTPTCPSGWIHCPDRQSCIPSDWKCDGIIDCKGTSEEIACGKDSILVSGAYYAKRDLKSLLLQSRILSSSPNKWGSQICRIAVALHLADESTFKPGNSTGDEIRYELTIQLLHRLTKDKKMSSQELALNIHALLAACMDPKDFYGENLVLELRRRVEAAENYTNPFQILVLCNAGDTMTARDVERVVAAYDSHHRPSWADLQALASMAVACIFSRREGIVDESIFERMLQELKGLQLRNGTISDFRTTAFVTQAMLIHDSYKKEFDMNASVQVLIESLKETKSLLHAYYALPVLSAKSLLNITASHCRKVSISEEEALRRALDVDGETMAVQYSIWIGDKITLSRTWRLRMRVNSTIYDAIETVGKIDNRQKVKYSIVDGKQFVTAVSGMEDDPEMGIYWFIYLRSSNSDEQPKSVEESPLDLKLLPNQEIILWYKPAPWNSQILKQMSITSN